MLYLFFQRDSLPDGGDDIAIGAIPVFIEHAQIDYPRARRDAYKFARAVRAIGAFAGGRNDTRDMRAMAVLVFAIPFGFNEILAIEDAGTGTERAIAVSRSPFVVIPLSITAMPIPLPFQPAAQAALARTAATLLSSAPLSGRSAEIYTVRPDRCLARLETEPGTE